MVEQMLSGGIPPDTIVLAVRAAELAIQNTTRASDAADSAAAKRRAWDRERKRAKRDVSTGIPPDKAESVSLIDLSSSGETVGLRKEESKKERVSTGIPPEFHPTRRRKKGPLPPEWQPPQRAYNLAVSLGLRAEQIEPQFRDYLASSGKQYADYDAGFCNFIRNAIKFGNGPRNGTPQGNIAPAFNDLIDRVRAFDGAPGVRRAAGETDVRLLPKG